MAKMSPEMRDWREGTMDELIGRLVANVGIDRAAAAMAVGIILDFVANEGPPDKAQSFLAKLPGADALRPQAAGEDADGMGGVMGAGLRMMGTGLSIGAVQSVTQQFVANAREKVGEEEEVSEFVAAIPGLAQFV
jgi:hypothetical protein